MMNLPNVAVMPMLAGRLERNYLQINTLTKRA
jgi:hypothetical protein